MGIFREHTPRRRNINTTVSSHRDHKDDLKTDFKGRCGYCNDIDTWRFIWFEIDHFVPQKILQTISVTEYSNLVYSCRSCNNAKRAKWPTGHENIHNENDIGFIDPCNIDYKTQFERLESGKIKPVTELGKWMYHEMNLDKPQHEIIWKIELVDSLIGEIESLPNIDDNLKNRLLELHENFRFYIKRLSDAGL